MLTTAILKVAAGTPVLAASLDPAAFLSEVSSADISCKDHQFDVAHEADSRSLLIMKLWHDWLCDPSA